MSNEAINLGLDRLYRSKMKDAMFYKLDEFKADIELFAKSNELEAIMHRKRCEDGKTRRGLYIRKI